MNPPSQDTMTPVRGGLDRVVDITTRGNFSKTYLYNLLAQGHFPQPAIRNGPRFTRWRAADVDAWFDDPAGWIAHAEAKAAKVSIAAEAIETEAIERAAVKAAAGTAEAITSEGAEA